MQIPLDRIYTDVFLCKVSLATWSLRFWCVASVAHFFIRGGFYGGKALNPSTYIPIIILWIIIFNMFHKRRKEENEIVRRIIKKRKVGGKSEMKALAERFVDKECVVYTFNGTQFVGIIKEVTDGAILVEKDGKPEAINLDFVIRIREYPVNKKGKKVSVVLD